MKKIFSIVIVSMMLILMFVPVYAADGDILKGTPIIDGELDEIYSQSVSYELGNFGFYTWADYTETVTATAYFLWDESYLYVCSVVKDAKICSSGQAYIDANQPNPWQNDAIENWFLDNGTKMKIHNDAFGLTMFGDPVGGLTFDIEKAVYKTSINGDTYVIETAIPFADMKVGREIGFAMQVNNIGENDNTKGGTASGTQTPDQTTYVCVAKEVTYPVVEEIIVEAPAQEAAPVVSAPVTTKAPQTSDNAVVSAIVLVMAAAAVIAFKKRSVK